MEGVFEGIEMGDKIVFVAGHGRVVSNCGTHLIVTCGGMSIKRIEAEDFVECVPAARAH
jgi:hypothetical protein